MAPVKHGAHVNGVPSKLYRKWLGMRNRCANPNHGSYKWYGGRGIKVCERWKDFAKFRDDMGDPPGSEYSLDRYPNPNGDYEPGNVRWATDEQQGNNKRGVRLISLPDGRTMSIAMAAREMNMSRLAIHQRINRGWPAERWLDPIDQEGGRIKSGEPHRRWSKRS